MGNFASTTQTGWHGNRWFDNGLTGCNGYIGETGTGKTYLTGAIARRCSRVIVFDTANAYGDGVRLTPLPGFLIADQPGQLKEYFRRYGDEPFQILYKPEGTYIRQHFEHVCKIAMKTRDVVLFCDEFWQFCNPSYMPPHVEEIVFRGRTPGVNLQWVVQQPQRVAVGAISQSYELRVFRCRQGHDLNALKKGRSLSDEALEIIRTLPDRQFLAIDMNGNYERCIVNERGEIEKL